MTQHHVTHIATLYAELDTTLQAEQTMLFAVRVLMLHQFKLLLDSEQVCRVDKQADALNGMQNNVRQLQTLLRLVESDMHPKRAKKIRKRLKRLSEHLDNVYELDVMMRDLLRYGEGVDHRMTIAGLVAHLDARRLVAKDRLIRYLDSPKYHDLLDDLLSVLQEPLADVFSLEDYKRYEPQQVRHVLPVLVHQSLATIRAYDVVIADMDAEKIMLLRSHIHDLTCILNGFEMLLDDCVVDYLDTLNHLGIMLDRIYQTSQTLNRLIHLPRASLDAAQLTALKHYRRNLRDRRETMLQELPDEWKTFNQKTHYHRLFNVLLALF